MEFNKRFLSVKIDGVGYKISYPSVDQLVVHEENISKSSKDTAKVLTCLKDFLDTLGLPKKVSGGLEVSSLKTIIEEVSGGEKK